MLCRPGHIAFFGIELNGQSHELTSGVRGDSLPATVETARIQEYGRHRLKMPAFETAESEEVSSKDPCAAVPRA